MIIIYLNINLDMFFSLGSNNRLLQRHQMCRYLSPVTSSLTKVISFVLNILVKLLSQNSFDMGTFALKEFFSPPISHSLLDIYQCSQVHVILYELFFNLFTFDHVLLFFLSYCFITTNFHYTYLFNF